MDHKRTFEQSEIADMDVQATPLPISKYEAAALPRRRRQMIDLAPDESSAHASTDASNAGEANFPKQLMSRKEFREEKALYGNYANYYARRNHGASIYDDPRLKRFSRGWFENRDVLDIGCNNGQFSMAISVVFQCKSMLGIDIDQGLIKEATRKLKARQRNEAFDYFPQSCALTQGHVDEDVLEEFVRRKLNSCGQISFASGDFVELAVQPKSRDVVMCLSVSKWIHLHHGDDGIRRLFKNVYETLRDGGLFIVEPQPFAGYKKRKNLTAQTAANYANIQLFPEQFADYLRDEVGFLVVDEVAELPREVMGEMPSRPILICKKAECEVEMLDAD